jgi:hypothetical protein
MTCVIDTISCDFFTWDTMFFFNSFFYLVTVKILVLCFSFVLFVFGFGFFCDTGVSTRGFMFAKQAPYHLNHSASPAALDGNFIPQE